MSEKFNMDHLQEKFSQRKDLERKAELDKQEKDKSLFEESCTKKVKTTMVGSVAAFEDKFSFLWEDEDDETGQKIKKLFMEARDSIFDLGNEQMNRMKSDFKKYDITKKKYTMKFFVNNRGEE